MKNKEVISGIVGGTFFAIPYLALSIAFPPSLAIGAGAFIASELILSTDKVQNKFKNISFKQIIENANTQNKHISNMIPKMNNIEIEKNLKEINKTVQQIIDTVSKNPNKIKSINNFFNYYLPALVKIVDHIDDIENQHLVSKESQKFLKTAENMVKEANKSFKNILAKLYQTDIVDSDAEMKLFNSMLKSDGFDEEINIKEDEHE